MQIFLIKLIMGKICITIFDLIFPETPDTVTRKWSVSPFFDSLLRFSKIYCAIYVELHFLKFKYNDQNRYQFVLTNDRFFRLWDALAC